MKSKIIPVLSVVVLFTLVLTTCRPVEKQHKIDSIELYMFNIEKPLHFSFGTYHNRQHIFVRIISGDNSGWSEHGAGRNNPDFDLKEYARDLRQLKGMDMYEALELVQSKYGDWNRGKLEVVELALYDLIGKVEKKPAVEILGLEGRDPVPGLFCVLEEDPEKAREQARVSLENNFRTHIKVKIFGKPDLDARLIREVRKEMGGETYITADVNKGYENWEDIDELAESMMVLWNNGLDACEDPAELDIPQWVMLQYKLPDLAIIPDYPMRPAWEALETAVPGMGEIYNLHPHAMGSIHLTVDLAHKIKSWDAKLMIGDASLIGPACTQWQQIAIGLGADWVEALEKPDQSGPYLECVKSLATYQDKDGKIAMKPEPGFGIHLDVDEIRKYAAKTFFIE